VRCLLAREQQVRAMVRRFEASLAFENIGAQSVTADLQYDVSYALAGCEAVICAAGAKMHEDPEAVDYRGTVKLIEEAKRQGTKRFILISSLGTTYPERVPEPLRPFLLAKRKAEEALEASGLPYTIIKPGGLTDAPGTGKVKVAPTLTEGGTIPRDDVAALAVQALLTGQGVGASFEVVSGDTDIEKALEQL